MVAEVYKIGNKYEMNSGEVIEILGRSGRKIKVRFLSDGWETECLSQAIKKGVLENKSHVIYPKIGDIYSSMNCGDFEIIDRVSKVKYTIMFINTGYVKDVLECNIRNGQIKDPFYPSIHGVGYIGGKMQNKDSYRMWSGFLGRCYDVNNQRYKTYGGDGVTVHKDWHNYQNFHNWWLDNYIGGYDLDKDLKVPGNKMYSADMCMFIPKRLNYTMSNYRNPFIKNSIGDLFVLTYGRSNTKIRSQDIKFLIVKWGELIEETLNGCLSWQDRDLQQYIRPWCDYKVNLHINRTEKDLLFVYN